MKRSLVYIDKTKIKEVFDMKIILDACDFVFRHLLDGREIVSPKKLSMVLPGNSQTCKKWLNAMPAYIKRSGISGIKSISVCSDNRQRSLPTTNGLIILNHLDSGVPFAVMDGELITHYRSAASVLLAAKRFAPVNSSSLLVIGPGEEGTYTARFLCRYFNIQRIDVFSLSDQNVDRFRSRVINFVNRPIQIQRTHHLKDSVSQADIVICSSSSRKPLLCVDHLDSSDKKHKFIVGFSAFGDIEPEVVKLVDALIFDDAKTGKARIKETCGIDVSSLNKHEYNMPEMHDKFRMNNSVGLYLPMGISAMDIEVAYRLYMCATTTLMPGYRSSAQ